jgi:hypothetical protein
LNETSACDQKSLIEEGQITQWPMEKRQRDKQSAKHYTENKRSSKKYIKNMSLGRMILVLSERAILVLPLNGQLFSYIMS